MQANYIRSGQTIRGQVIADTISQGADTGAGFTDAGQCLGDEMGDAGLAIGAGNSNNGHSLPGIAEETAHDMTVGAIQLIDSDPVRIDLLTQQWNPLQAILVSRIVDDRDRSRLHCIDSVIDTIGFYAGQCDERRIRGNIYAVTGDI